MKHGKISGVEKSVSRLIQGLMWLKRDEPEVGFAVLDYLIENGCNAFDTAHVYGPNAEGLLGDWHRVRKNREGIVIVGKGCHPKAGVSRVNKEGLTEDITVSLERLQTDYIDLYLLHRDDPTVEVGGIVEMLNEEKEKGRIHAFGGSNWSHQRLAEANAYAVAHGLTPFVASSPCFNLVDQVNSPWPNCISISGPRERAARDWYREQGIAVLGWSGLAGGFLTGIYSRDSLHSEDPRMKEVLRSYGSEANFKTLDRLEEVATQKRVSMPQVALAYTLNTGLNAFSLCGCARLSDAEDNIKGVELALSEVEVRYLEGLV